jgi:PUA domain protein
LFSSGLTSPGAKMEDVPAGVAVGVFAEGKQCAMAVGLTKMSTEQM